MTEGNPTVEEARRKALPGPCPYQYCSTCADRTRAVDDLIEAVRQEERERYENDLITTWVNLARENQLRARNLLARPDGA